MIIVKNSYGLSIDTIIDGTTNLLDPDTLAKDIADNLEDALAQFKSIVKLLAWTGKPVKNRTVPKSEQLVI